MKTLTISILTCAMTFAVNTQLLAQEKVDMFVTQPCHFAWKDIPVTHGNEVTGVALDVSMLEKTDTRKTFADITPKEWRHFKKLARRLHACEIVVDDDYKLPKQVAPDPEKEAMLNGYIHIYIVVPNRPCPECPQPTTTSKT